MAWTAPMTAVANTTWTAAQFNTHVRDNLNTTAPALATAAGNWIVPNGANTLVQRTMADGDRVTASETTSSTSYTTLTTAGPSVTITTGTTALVFVGAAMSNDQASGGEAMSFAISGSTSVSASDTWAQRWDGANTSSQTGRWGMWRLVTGLTAGSNTFAARYRAIQTGTATFANRELIVVNI